MAYFYDEFLKGKTVSEALFKAKNIIHNEHDESPIHWAVYSLYGNPFVTIKVTHS